MKGAKYNLLSKKEAIEFADELLKDEGSSYVFVQGYSDSDQSWDNYDQLFKGRNDHGEVRSWINNYSPMRLVAQVDYKLRDQISPTGKKYGDYDGKVFYENGDVPKVKLLECHGCGKDCLESESLVGIWGCREDLDPLDSAFCPTCIEGIRSGDWGSGKSANLGKCEKCGWITSDNPYYDEDGYLKRMSPNIKLCTECYEKEGLSRDKALKEMTAEELKFEIARLEREIGKHIRVSKIQKIVRKKNHRNRKNIVG